MTRSTIVVPETGPPDVLRALELPLVDLTGSEVRVLTSLVGVNFWDVMQRRGDVPLPADRVPGVEGVGVVTAVGPDADPSLMGSRVAWSKVPSSYSSVVQGPQASFITVPDDVTDEAAAGALMQGVTAQYLATDTTSLGAGQWAVVTAAAGGVGGLLTQSLVARGVEVIAVVGSAAKRDAARLTGADRVLVDSASLVDDVRAIAAEGVDAVFDAAGGHVARLFGMLRPRGICVLYGAAGSPIAPIEPGALAAGSFYLTRTAGRDYAATAGEWTARALDVMSRVADGSLVVRVGDTLPLASAAEAHRRLEDRMTTGKVLLSTR